MLITLLVLCFFNHVAFAADITYFTVIPNTRSEDKTNLTNTIFEVTVDDSNSGLECVGPGEETLVSDCLVTEYTLINNTRAENKDFLVGTSEVDGDLEKCKAACTAEPSCVIFTYN
eukprot:Awhi_evm1s459